MPSILWAIMQNMFAVMKPGRFVALNHFRNEEEYSSYGHLHQWNFDGGRCWLWRQREEHDLGNVFFGKATIECRTEPGPPDGKEGMVCIIMKQSGR
jgi:hypothetical protein